MAWTNIHTDDIYDLISGAEIKIRPSGDIDDYLTIETLTNVPTIKGVGAYTRFGDAAFTSHTLASEDDVMVSGKLEVDGPAHFDGAVIFYASVDISSYIRVTDNLSLCFGTGLDGRISYNPVDTDAKAVTITMDEGADSGNNVPAWIFGEETNVKSIDLNLLDEVVQPHIVTMENSGKYASDSAMTAAGAQATMIKTAEFGSSLVGDIVRVTGGTNATPGWYWITTVTDADTIVLDRNWCTGAVTNGVASLWHKVSMITPKTIYMPIYDGAPGDGDIDIDMAGAMALDVGQANGRLYWRVGAAWHYVDATAGVSIPKDEVSCPICGEEIELGQAVVAQINEIMSDGGRHGLWCHLACVS